MRTHRAPVGEVISVAQVLEKTGALCLPQIPSAAGGGRRMAAANQLFGPCYARRNGEAREIDAAIGEQRKSCLVESENRRTVLVWELRRGLLRSGCAAFVAVVKTANLRYDNHSSDCRRVQGPRFQCVLGE